jgi:hypothetical protein
VVGGPAHGLAPQRGLEGVGVLAPRPEGGGERGQLGGVGPPEGDGALGEGRVPGLEDAGPQLAPPPGGVRGAVPGGRGAGLGPCQRSPYSEPPGSGKLSHPGSPILSQAGSPMLSHPGAGIVSHPAGKWPDSLVFEHPTGADCLREITFLSEEGAWRDGGVR